MTLRCLLPLAHLVVLPLSLNAGTRVIDGDASDWTGVPSPTIYDTEIKGDEWMHAGEVGDLRSDPSGDLGNYDLTEVRLTNDDEHHDERAPTSTVDWMILEN